MRKIIIYTDGGSRGNPGRAALGVVFCNEKEQEIKKYGEYLGDNLTNNEAEYQAVIFALKKFKELFGGIVIPADGQWRYNDNEKYEYNPNDLKNWKFLDLG